MKAKNIGLLLFSFFLFFSTGFSFSQSSSANGIVEAIKLGDASSLSKFFNANVELVVIDKQGVFSKAQTQQIMKNFFLKHKPQKFVLAHEGGKGAKFLIGKLITDNGKFRVSLFLKKKDGGIIIHRFRVEKS